MLRTNLVVIALAVLAPAFASEAMAQTPAPVPGPPTPMDTKEAKSLVNFALTEEFGRTYLDSEASSKKCKRINTYKFRCSIYWVARKQDNYDGYVGQISVENIDADFFEASYKIKQYSGPCLVKGGTLRQCYIKTHRL